VAAGDDRTAATATARAAARRRRRLPEHVASTEQAHGEAERHVERQPWAVEVGHGLRLSRELRRRTRAM
ncbi:MAG: hypothetical protein AVDCRST_MAG67-2981, partial [uncultured Solirubrobacteraceae bacterium]